MTLLENLKIKRALDKKKRPLRPSLYEVVIRVAQEHRLRDDFLEKLDDVSLKGTGYQSPPDTIRPKPALAPRLFPLAGEADYRLAQAIISKVNNPYLFYAYGPEEILLCPALYRLNPGLEADKLVCCHFEMLLAYELAQQELQDLGEPSKNPDGQEEPGGEAGLTSRQARIEELRELVDRVESRHFKSGD